MSVEAFVRSAGGVMGGVRDGFGASGGSALLPLPATPPPAPPAQAPGSGDAAEGQENSGWQISNKVAALADQDNTAHSEVESAAGSSGLHQGEMTLIIDQAVADVQSMGLATNTPEGKRALITAIMQRLEETRGTAEAGTADAGTHAASTAANVAGYNDIGGVPRGPSPLAGFGGAMPGMGGGMPGGMPGMGGGMPGMGGLSALGQPLSALSGLASPAGQTITKAAASERASGSGSARNVSSAGRISVKDVRFDREKFAVGREAYKRYVAEALDVMGITDPQARENWSRGLMTAAARESSFNPLAINLTDSNAHGAAAADGYFGNSSRGGLQTIPTTFAANHQPGTSTNIYDPVANISAAMNYVMGRYNVSRDGSDLTKVAQFNPGSAGGGY
ncbi:transglycosylase SLT domain-containing protein (plasmid) [Mycobacterium sp. smrl_JER01]|uniref:transglycosylase SLT domain-containing protein n=1 Tax=Mycobacterium sp. smrl_JER01 TaxID=3402633 RepID=UPI003AC86C35